MSALKQIRVEHQRMLLQPKVVTVGCPHTYGLKAINLSCTCSIFGQRDPDRCLLLSLHLLLGSGHLLLSAGVLQKHRGQVAQAGALREGEAQHALQYGWISDLRAGWQCCEVHEGGDGWQDGLFSLAWQTISDQGDAAALQDDVTAFRVHAEVAEAPWECARVEWNFSTERASTMESYTHPSQTPQSCRSPLWACPRRGRPPAAPSDAPCSSGRMQNWLGWRELAPLPLK